MISMKTESQYVTVNHLIYTDDLVPIAPSAHALQSHK